MISTSKKAHLHSDPHTPQATTLLSWPPDHSGLVLSLGRDHPKPRSYWKDRQVVGRAHGRDPHLHPMQSHQVLSTCRFHRRMNRYLAPPSASPGGALDDVLRQITQEDGSRRGLTLHLTPWHPHVVHNSHSFCNL